MLRRRALPVRRSNSADLGTQPLTRRSSAFGSPGANASGGLVTTTRAVSPVSRAETKLPSIASVRIIFIAAGSLMSTSVSSVIGR
jgi:hypothetical protein